MQALVKTNAILRPVGVRELESPLRHGPSRNVALSSLLKPCGLETQGHRRSWRFVVAKRSTTVAFGAQRSRTTEVSLLVVPRG